MPRGRVIVSAAAISSVERKIAAHEKKIARHQREREKLIATRDAMRTILGPSVNGYRAATRLAEKSEGQPKDHAPSTNELNVPRALMAVMEKNREEWLTPRDIRDAVLSIGVKPEQMGAAGTYLYSVIARALGRGQIVSRNGRYRLAPGRTVDYGPSDADLKQ